MNIFELVLCSTPVRRGRKWIWGKVCHFTWGYHFNKGIASKRELEQGQVAEPQQMEDLQQVDLLYIVSMEAGIPGSP